MTGVARIIDSQEQLSGLRPPVVAFRVGFDDARGTPATAVVRPLAPARGHFGRGTVIGIRYDPRNPRSASYAGPGGDVASVGGVLLRRTAVGLLRIVGLLALHGLARVGFLVGGRRRGGRLGAWCMAILPIGGTSSLAPGQAWMAAGPRSGGCSSAIASRRRPAGAPFTTSPAGGFSSTATEPSSGRPREFSRSSVADRRPWDVRRAAWWRRARPGVCSRPTATCSITATPSRDSFADPLGAPRRPRGGGSCRDPDRGSASWSSTTCDCDFA